MIARIACIALAWLGAASAASAYDAHLDAALARTALATNQAQGLVRITSTVLDENPPEVETETVDPKKDPKKALPSYAELKEVIGADAHVVGQTAGRTTYAFTTRRVPRGFSQAGSVSVNMDGKDDDETFDGTAEVSLDGGGKPYVSHVDLRLHSPAGNWLARVKKIDLGYTFGPDAGRADAMVATAVDVEVAVRALLFVNKHVRVHAVRVPAQDTAGTR